MGVFCIGDLVTDIYGYEWDVTNIENGVVYLVGPLFWNIPFGDKEEEDKVVSIVRKENRPEGNLFRDDIWVKSEH